MSFDANAEAKKLFDIALAELAEDGENWSLSNYSLAPDEKGWATTVVNLGTREAVSVNFTIEFADGVKANMDRATIDAIKQQIRKSSSASR